MLKMVIVIPLGSVKKLIQPVWGKVSPLIKALLYRQSALSAHVDVTTQSVRDF